MLHYKKNSMRSKQGFALATVIVVSCVIVILATSLIGIAVASTESTSGNIDERQAYLNAKSALDYGTEYYKDGTMLPSLAVGTNTGEEYILMKDMAGGTSEEGADVMPVSTDTTPYKTYVHTFYDKSAATLTLRAYAKSSDAFGKKSKSTTLSVTYKIGSGGGKYGRQLPTSPATTSLVTSDDTINIHVRRDPNATGDYYFNPAIYTWSYYSKKNGNDFGVNWNNVNVSGKPITDWNKITVNQMNQIESEANKFEPAGKWLSTSKGDSISGPKTKMDQEVGSNDWFVHSFSPSAKAQENGGSDAKMVPWFNLIVSRQTTDSRFTDKKEGSQSAEFLNVWYFDEADKNIYVEILKSPLWYYKSTNWNGKDNLEGRLIAYANAPQTVYYVKKEGKNDNSLAPSISVTGSTGSFGSGAMTYSGYGWWSFRSTASKSDSPTVTVTTSGSTITVPNVSSSDENPIMNRTAYIIIDSSGSARTCISEEAAAIASGDQDYVTVYAKAYKNNSISSPKISYLVETHSDSAAKRNLKQAIDDADVLYKADYTDESWSNFIATLNNAKSVYNNPTLQDNSTYNTEVSNIQNAKNALSFKPVDTTALEALIQTANSKVQADYTLETYSAMVTIRNQAQTLVNNVASGTVNQSDINAKATALEAKINALDLIAPYRESLNNKLEEARTTRDNNPTSPVIQTLIDAISDGESYVSSNSKNDIENVITNLTRAINKVLNVGDTTELTSVIAEANRIITNDASLLISGTLTNLRNITNEAETKLNTVTLNQDQVDSYVAAVNDAIKKLVYTPKDNIPEVESGKKRIWLELTSLGNSDNYYIYAWYGAGGEGKQNVAFGETGGSWISLPQVKLKFDANSGYYYYDLENKYTNFIIVRDDGRSITQTHDLTYDANKNFIIINAPKGGSAPTYAKLATIYSEIDSPWNNLIQYAYVRSSSTSSLNTSSLTANRLARHDESGKYYIQRIAFDSSSKFYIHNGSDSGNSRTVDITLHPGDNVILYPEKNFEASTNVTVDADTLANILARTPVSRVKASGSVNASKISYNGSSASVVKTAASAGYVDSAIPSDPLITVYFKKPSGWSNDVFADVAQIDDSNNVVSGTEQGNLRMITTDNSYFSIKLDSSRVNSILISDSSSSSRKTSRLKLATDSSSKYYNVQLVSEKSGGGYKIAVYTSTQATISTADVIFSDVDKKMAFVGGKKQVFTNVRDARSGRNDMLGNPLSSSQPFSNSGEEGYARVGLTSYSTYYDWYEYKIPAGSSDLYSFQIKGLNKDSASTSTMQVHQVWGNVWLSLDGNLAKDSKGRYKVTLSTVNPENSVTQEKTKIYITQNADLIANHGGMQLTMWGTEAKTVRLNDTYDGRFYVEIPQGMPFLQLSSVDGYQVYPMTKLQGGDKILYDYSAGAGGTPTWLTYVPANVALQRELANAESIGNGWILYNYSASSHAVSSSVAPLALINMSDLTAPENQSHDPATDQARADLLAKWTVAYQNLYNEISKARAYITIDNSGNPVWYPENDCLTSGATYSTDSIKELYNLVNIATTEYGKSSASLSNLISYAEQISAKVNELKPEVTGKAILILEDVAGWGGNIQVRYTDSSGNTVTKMVTSKNSAGNPMIFVDVDSQITDVQFGYGIGSIQWGSVQSVVIEEEEWVYNNNSDPYLGGWSPNSVPNYFTLSTSSYVQSTATETKIVSDKATEENFTLYFVYNTKVTYKPSIGAAERTYTIPAGAYSINMPNYKTYYTGSGTAPDEVNLYSQMAEDYFTKPENQGMSSTGADSESLSWTSSGNIVNHSILYSHSGDVNFVASSGSLNGSYSVMGSFYFRWNGDSTCNVRSGTTITASDFTFASPQTISGGSTISPTFILSNSSTDPTAKLRFKFLTNIDVTYKDASGSIVNFTIVQGTYEAVNPGDVNFFDREFWTTGVTLNTGTGSSSEFLTEPIYSTD